MLGFLLSVVILVTFGVLQEREAKFLSLESQWIFIAILPLLVALFIGGYITRFSGFGFDLEAALKEPVSASIDISATEVIAKVPAAEKQSVEYLESLSAEKKASIRLLRFDLGRAEYYIPIDVQVYLGSLPDLQFLEVISAEGRFVCFLPASYFRLEAIGSTAQQFDADQIVKFTESLRNNNVLDDFREVAVTRTVNSRDNLLDVIKLMWEEQVGITAVLSADNRYLGVLFIQDVEKKIANAVLKSQGK